MHGILINAWIPWIFLIASIDKILHYISSFTQNQLHASQENTNETSANAYKSGIYGQNGTGQDYLKNESHKRQASSLHGHFTPSKSHNMNENSPVRGSKEGMYAGAPDLPPRVDRTAKPASLSKATSNR